MTRLLRSLVSVFGDRAGTHARRSHGPLRAAARSRSSDRRGRDAPARRAAAKPPRAARLPQVQRNRPRAGEVAFDRPPVGAAKSRARQNVLPTSPTVPPRPRRARAFRFSAALRRRTLMPDPRLERPTTRHAVRVPGRAQLFGSYAAGRARSTTERLTHHLGGAKSTPRDGEPTVPQITTAGRCSGQAQADARHRRTGAARRRRHATCLPLFGIPCVVSWARSTSTAGPTVRMKMLGAEWAGDVGSRLEDPDEALRDGGDLRYDFYASARWLSRTLSDDGARLPVRDRNGCAALWRWRAAPERCRLHRAARTPLACSTLPRDKGVRIIGVEAGARL